jgi:hypothetical protein
VALASLGTDVGHLYAHLPPGLGWGALGGFAYALAEFLILSSQQEDLAERPRRRLYLAPMTARVILGAIVGAATLALGPSGAAFVAGLAGPQALVALGAKFGRSRSRPGRKEAESHANDRSNARKRT